MEWIGKSTPARRYSGGSALCGLCLAALYLIATASPVVAQAPAELKQQGYVNDFGGFLTEDERSQISAICQKVDTETGYHLLVVTTERTGTLTPGQFGEELRGAWFDSPIERERAMLVVVNGEGKIGVGIGKTVERSLTREQFESDLRGSLAVGGTAYGPKLLYLVQHLSGELASGARRGGQTSDLMIFMGMIMFGMGIWLSLLIGSERRRSGLITRVILLILPLAFLWLLNRWFGPIEGQSDGVRLHRIATLGLVFFSWIVGIAIAFRVSRDAR